MSEWPSIEWDDDRYPNEDGLEAVKTFFKTAPLDFKKAAAFVIYELQNCSKNCLARCEVTDANDSLDNPAKRIEFSTGGWSGAEEIIELLCSRFDLRHFMFSWERGGHYVFEVPLHFLEPPASSPVNPSQNMEGDNG